MRLQSIELQNYRPYYGTSEEIVLEWEGTSNIFVIEGRNGAGKTSLHEAISWCLYAPKMGGGRTQYKRINRKAIEEGEENAYVRLKFDHDGDLYNVIRTAEVVGNNRAKTSLQILKNGEPVSGNENKRQQRLENIIPKNVSEFLFFDGEEMERLAKKMNGVDENDDVKEQIELLIGLKAVQNAVADLEYVQGKIDDEIDEEREKLDQKEELNVELKEKKEEKDQLVTETDELQESIDSLKEDKTGVENLLDEIESEKMEELKSIKAEIVSLEEDRIPELQEKYKTLIQYGHIFILHDSIDSAIEEFRKDRASIDARLSELNISDAKKRLVQESLSEHVCELCGQDIDQSSRGQLSKLQERFNINEEERSSLENKKVELSDRIEDLQDALRRAGVENPAEIKQEIDRLRDRKEDLEVEYEQLSSNVQSSEDEKSRLQSEKEKLEEEITDKTAKLQNRENRIEEIDDRIETLRGQIDSISKTSVMKDLEKQEGAIQECIEDLNSLRDGLVKKKRDSILKKANEVFRQLTSDNRGYNRFEFIDEDKYGFQIISNDGNRPDMDDISKGEKQIVALSFIIGLNRYADRDAPLIMDTPIARLDMEYRQNLASLLADLDEQIILLVTDASLAGGFEEILKDDISGKWDIVENTSDHTSNFERTVV